MTLISSKTDQLKSKDLQNPWTLSDIKRCSKQKQRLYEKFIKDRNAENELE